jgi:hypothetical protein
VKYVASKVTYLRGIARVTPSGRVCRCTQTTNKGGRYESGGDSRVQHSCYLCVVPGAWSNFSVLVPIISAQSGARVVHNEHRDDGRRASDAVHNLLQCQRGVRHSLFLSQVTWQITWRKSDTYFHINSTCGRNLPRVYFFTWILHGGYMATNFRPTAEGVC